MFIVHINLTTGLSLHPRERKYIMQNWNLHAFLEKKNHVYSLIFLETNFYFELVESDQNNKCLSVSW